MATFRYQAVDENGRAVAGQIEASGLEEARDALRQRGLSVSELAPAADVVPPVPGAMNADEAQEFAQTVAQLSHVNMALTMGLRAAAEETSNRRVAAALAWLAALIEQGQTLEDALRSTDNLIPRPLRGLILAAAGTGKLGAALTEMAEYHQAARALKRAALSALAYPLLIVGITAALLSFVCIYIGGIFEKMFNEFELSLPVLTRFLFWFRHTGIWVLVGFVGVLALCALLYRWRVGRGRWQQQMATMPLFGRLWYWLAVAEWSGLLSVLLRYKVPLPEALRLAADGVHNAHMSQLSVTLANGVATGRSLSQLLANVRGMPKSLAPLVRWGEQTGTLAEAFSTGHDMFQSRVRQRSLLLQTILPPGMLVLVGGGVLFVVSALFIPLISLVQGLS